MTKFMHLFHIIVPYAAVCEMSPTVGVDEIVLQKIIVIMNTIIPLLAIDDAITILSIYSIESILVLLIQQ